MDMGSYCSLSQHGQTLPHPLDCTRYVQCVGRKSVEFRCYYGTVFDPDIKQCRWYGPEKCKDEDFKNWSSWSQCFKPTPDDRCVRRRSRNCKPNGKYCNGFKSQVQKCNKCKGVRPCQLNNGV